MALPRLADRIVQLGGKQRFRSLGLLHGLLHLLQKVFHSRSLGFDILLDLRAIPAISQRFVLRVRGILDRLGDLVFLSRQFRSVSLQISHVLFKLI